MLAEAARQTERLEAAEATTAAALAQAERCAAAEAEAVAATEASRAEANRLRQGAAGAHEATTRRLMETTRRLVQESEERHEAVRAENNGLRSENEKLKRELENARENERLAAAREAKRKLARDRASVKAAETERRRAENLAAKAEAVRREQERTLLKQHAAAQAVLAAAAGEETAHAEANRLQSENERLKLELESVVATPDYWHAFRQHWKLYGAKSLGATTPALADAEQHHAAEAASAAAFEAKCAEADELRSEIERSRLELDQERERTAAARAAAVERSSVGDEGVEESKSETQAPSTRVSFDAAEKISVVGSTPVEGETCGSRASSPKRKKSAWLCGGARAVTPPPSSRSSHVVSYDESDGGRRSRPHQVQYLRSYREPSRSPSRDEDYGDSICGFASFTSASYTSASYTSARSSREAFISRYDPYANRDITQDYGF